MKIEGGKGGKGAAIQVDRQDALCSVRDPGGQRTALQPEVPETELAHLQPTMAVSLHGDRNCTKTQI